MNEFMLDDMTERTGSNWVTNLLLSLWVIVLPVVFLFFVVPWTNAQSRHLVLRSNVTLERMTNEVKARDMYMRSHGMFWDGESKSYRMKR